MICNDYPSPGYVYANSADDVNVRARVNEDDNKAKFEYMDDGSIRSLEFDMCLAQTISGGQIAIKLKECKGT